MNAINKNLILEAAVLEPYKSDTELPFSADSRGWQVSILMAGSTNESPYKILVDKQSKKDCIELVEMLGLVWL